MRAAKERPPAKPPWVTSASTAHPTYSQTLDHTTTINANHENQSKSLTPTAPTPTSKVRFNRRYGNYPSTNLRTLQLPS
eukprot:8848446-Ditylum_brightwellii.AAC.1